VRQCEKTPADNVIYARCNCAIIWGVGIGVEVLACERWSAINATGGKGSCMDMK